MFFGEFVPYIGPVLAAIPGLAVALTDSPRTALYALIVYVTVQQLENHLLVPYVMKKAVKLQPALLIGWQLLVASTFGLAGVIVATPLLAVLQIAVDHFYVEPKASGTL